MEFPTPTGIEARKLVTDEILEILENGIPTFWKLQMDKEACESHPKRGGKHKAKSKASKKLTVTGDKILHDIILMTEEVTIASTM
eukprot:8395233-Ditylum_brightwellii.AAC.1